MAKKDKIVYVCSNCGQESTKWIGKCPSCGKGMIVEKRSRRGKVFYGCNNYPKCKTAYWDKPVDRKCPECGEMLVEKAKKVVCSACKYEEE